MSDFSARDRVRSFGYAGRGLRLLVSGQHNAWIHLALTLVAIALGLALAISLLEWCLIAIVIGGVWVAEGINTSIELLADASVPEQHPKVGQAKDVAAGAVLIAACVALVVGAVIFVPRLVSFVS